MGLRACRNQCHRKREKLRTAYSQAGDGNSHGNEVTMWGGNSASGVRCSRQQQGLGGVSGTAGSSAGL